MWDKQQTIFIILSKSLYFGWLLSFPLYGPVLYNSAPFLEFKGFPLVLIFAFSHGLSHMLGGVLIKNINLWYKLMLISIILTLGANAALLLPFSWLWVWIMAAMGICSGLYVLGWSCLYSMALPVKGRLKIMSAVIIGSNLVFIIFNLLANILPSRILLAAVAMPLAVALLIQAGVPFNPSHVFNRPKTSLPLPRPLLLIFSLFVFILYFNGGFLYRIMLPALDTGIPFFSYYRFIPYILVLLVMYRYGERLQRYFTLYMGVSLLGLSFVSFALLNSVTAGLLMTTALVEAAFALLDLFVWTTLGILAFIYGAPYLFFGLTMAATAASIISGDLIGDQLLRMGQAYHLVTAILAAASIFLAFTVMPWLNQRIETSLSLVLGNKHLKETVIKSSTFNRLKHCLLPGQKLTPREVEITRLILQGLTNKDIALQLFISINTLKTHLKHIYQKFGVSQKRELLSLAVRTESKGS